MRSSESTPNKDLLSKLASAYADYLEVEGTDLEFADIRQERLTTLRNLVNESRKNGIPEEALTPFDF